MPVPNRDLELAKQAYSSNNKEQSKLVHSIANATEQHKLGQGKYIKSIVFGGLDGIITTFAIVAGVNGADLNADFVLVLGFANLLADGISMGFGDAISSQAELDYESGEVKREKWEFDNFPEGEVKEMMEIYTSKGVSEEDARIILTTMSKYPDFFVEHMCVQELEIMAPSGDENPAIDGLVTFASFLVFGFVPLFAYIILYTVDVSSGVEFAVSCIFTVVTLFALGFVGAHLSGGTQAGKLRNALKTLANGVIAAGSAYLVGWALGEAFGISSQCG